MTPRRTQDCRAAQSGNVVRFEGEYLDYFYDFSTDKTAYFGLDPAHLCSTGEWIGTSISVMEVWKSDGTRFKNHLKGQLQTFVYAGPPDCAVILANHPLASGVVHIRTNGNDVWPAL